MASKFVYYPNFCSGEVEKLKRSDVKKGARVWHIGDTFPTFKEAVDCLLIETAKEQSEIAKEIRAAAIAFKRNVRLLSKIKKLKKSKEYK